uniref:Ribonuclease n=1 Tax=Glossina morsitans morsitans TaxID=37546 RepID=D3TLW3_GLOMM
MLRKSLLFLVTLIVISPWLLVLSASFNQSEPEWIAAIKRKTDEILKSFDAKTSEKVNNAERQYKNIPHNLFLSDEFTSSEYHDDVDMELNFDQTVDDNHNNDWDLLIFTQQWPATTCYHWREQDKNHVCKLPNIKEFWTIHGIWPTKLGHMGPSFCNKTANFDINALQDIMERMNLFWPDIDGEESPQDHWLWKHEWLKHGTCAATLDQLNNEIKYFDQGLKWRENYLISNILRDSNIHPDSNNTVVALHTALIKGLGKNPSIHCLYDGKNDISYLADIRICFNKSLELVDCDGVLRDATSIDYPGGTVITNCHISQAVHYPSLVPGRHIVNERKWKFPIVNLYKLIQFIMWFTL